MECQESYIQSDDAVRTARSASGFRGALSSGIFHVAGNAFGEMLAHHGNASGSVFPGRCGRIEAFARSPEVHASQSTLSRAIKSLEAELGGDLFRREDSQ